MGFIDEIKERCIIGTSKWFNSMERDCDSSVMLFCDEEKEKVINSAQKFSDLMKIVEDKKSEGESVEDMDEYEDIEDAHANIFGWAKQVDIPSVELDWDVYSDLEEVTLDLPDRLPQTLEIE